MINQTKHFIDIMDTRPKIEPPRVKRVLSVNFNDDKSCFAIGLEEGFMGKCMTTFPLFPGS